MWLVAICRLEDVVVNVSCSSVDVGGSCRAVIPVTKQEEELSSIYSLNMDVVAR